MANVIVDSDGCWIWSGPHSPGGYPRFAAPVAGRRCWAAAHTWMLRLWTVGQPPPVRPGRRCGKASCVRPACVTVRRAGAAAPRDRTALRAEWKAGALCRLALSRKHRVDRRTLNRLIAEWELVA